jgi:CBS domain containing-hemolysin-like protein
VNDLTMSDNGAKDPGSEQPPAAAGERPAEESGERPGERWLDRIRAAVGMKSTGSIRTDLAAALAASDDLTAGFTPEERAMLTNILRLREVRVDDIKVPRADIDAVDVDTTLSGLLLSFRKSGHSRMPVYRETLDDPVGLIHIKDLMGYITRVAEAADGGTTLGLERVDLSRRLGEVDLVRNILFVPPSMPVAALLANMQASRMQMALVIAPTAWFPLRMRSRSSSATSPTSMMRKPAP